MAEHVLTDTFFENLDLHPQLQQGLHACGFTRCTPIQSLTLPVALTGPRRRRPGADRHRQDLRLPGGADEPPADAAGACRPQGQRSARPGHRPDPRTGDPDREGRPRHRPRHRPAHRPDLRRRRLRQAAPAAARRLRHHHRHAGPPARLLQAARVRPELDRGDGDRRGRPHVRPRLHQGRALHLPPPAAARRAPGAAVLGHPQPPRAGAGLRAHERGREAGGGDRQRHRRQACARWSTSRPRKRRCRCC